MWPWLWFLLLVSPSALGNDCPRLHQHETVTVRKILDGDTILLMDGRVIRFIGIDTPELNKHRSAAAEDGALAAARWLAKKIEKGSRLKLVFGPERRDDYGRLLAHPLTGDGRLLVASMLAAGLGELLLLPPNTAYWPCLLAAEQAARRQRLGVWSQPLEARPVGGGIQRLRVRVQDVRWRGDRVILHLQGGGRALSGNRLPVADRQALAHVGAGDWLFLRGWVQHQEPGWQLWLNHPWQFYREK